MGARDVFDIDRFQIRRPEFENLGTEQDIAAIAGNIAQLLESEQAAVAAGMPALRAMSLRLSAA
jgi:hypothetical protein